MASISRGADGNSRLRFTDASGIRRVVYLGRMTVKQTNQVRGHVERIVVATISRCSVDPETARWLDSLDDVLRGKLSKVDLIQARETATLEAFIELYITSRNDAKPSTKTVWRRTRRHLLAHFDAKSPLRKISKSGAKGFRQYLIGEGLAENTVRRTCGVAKQFFQDALDRELVDCNPFKQRDIPTTTGGNQERQAYITHETAKAVLDACPDAEWRLLFALSRFAGLRCPSEHLALRWSDVNWERNRMVVRSSKTEHHEGGAMRVVPLFPEFRPYLEAVFELACPGTEFVINRYRQPNANLRTPLEKIIKRAGVKPWPKLFHNLRASCETDLAKIHPIKAVCDWIGNSVTVAQRHYLQTTEADFDKAAGVEAAHNPAQHTAVLPRIESHEKSSRKEKHWVPSVSPCRRVGDEGLEPTTSTV
jgi:integrase